MFRTFRSVSQFAIGMTLVAGLLFGCDSGSGASSTSGGGSSAAIPIDNLQNEVKALFCQMYGCMGAWFSTPTGCADQIAASPPEMQEVQWAKAGLITYDGAQARACLNAMMASCSLEGPKPEACDKAFVGKIADGKPCDTKGLCTSAYCNKKPGEACGVCAARVAAGGDCQMDDDCATGLTCADNKCVALGSVAVGGKCNADRACTAGNFCKDEGNSGVCTAKIDKDGACDLKSGGCKDGLVCSGDVATMMASAKCVAPHKAGEACGNPYPPSGDCEKGLLCGFAMPTKAGDKLVTKCVSYKKVGEACEFAQQCGIDGFCSAGKCAALPKMGDPCTPAAQGQPGKCAPSAYCNDKGTCTALPIAGDACSPDNMDCAAGLTCMFGPKKCAAPGKVGEACDDSGMDAPRCMSGLFCGKDKKCSATPTCT